MKRKHDRSSHEVVHCTTPLFFNPALRLLCLAAWLAAKSVQTGPVKPAWMRLFKFSHPRWLSLRRLFSEDCANRPQNECWCGAASRAHLHNTAKRLILFQICTTRFFRLFEKQYEEPLSKWLILCGSRFSAHVPETLKHAENPFQRLILRCARFDSDVFHRFGVLPHGVSVFVEAELIAARMCRTKANARPISVCAGQALVL
ncbi:hypothetical protein G3N95_29665 [Paraburkholderia sp. Tr-20389]|nr:hypothetical protein [Paraburkholderia sp. Tr-20389]